MRGPNRWHAAIRDQFARVNAPQKPDQIWEGMEAAGFKHASKMPRSTLGARLAEMVAEGTLKRVGPATYRLCALAEEAA